MAMMRRRRFGVGRRRVRSPNQWFVPIWNGNTPVALAANTLQTTLLVDARTGASAGGTIPAIAKMTVLRIVGLVGIGNADNVPGQYSMGIITRQFISGDTVPALDPSLGADADSPWLWLRHGGLEQATSGAAAVGPGTAFFASSSMPFPSRADVDIRVKRVLRPGDGLFLYIKAVPATQTLANLRVLIGKVA